MDVRRVAGQNQLPHRAHGPQAVVTPPSTVQPRELWDAEEPELGVLGGVGHAVRKRIQEK
jgi:hypothetical protein